MKNIMYPFRAVLIITLSYLLISSSIFAQSPEKMSYQAVIRNSSNALVTNQAVGMKISILKGSNTGSAVYIETYIPTPTTNANGLVTIEIGTGIPLTGNFSAIDWPAGPYFIKTETDPTGGVNYTLTGTTQLLSVPYALHAKTADNFTGTITSNQNLNDVLTQNNSAGNKNITNLATPVNAQDAATKAYVDLLKTQIEELQSLAGIIIKDIDGNVYHSVKIGNQVWMVENLKTTTSNNGTAIQFVTNNLIWSASIIPAYCWYNNDSATYSQTYGALYNWHTINAGNLCPTGWHVRSDTDWTSLTTYLGSEILAGGKLKETGTAHWNSPNTGATNKTGFTALPGGQRASNGSFSEINSHGYWWSDANEGFLNAWYRSLNYNSIIVSRNNDYKMAGFSVRCVKD